MARPNQPALEKRVMSFVSLCRYRTWSTTLRAIALPALHEARPQDGLLLTPTVALISYWLVSLRVVCEGWDELGLEDQDVDRLVASPHVKLLQRYRNGVCHFQRDFADDRFQDLISNDAAVRWLEELDKAFEAYFEPHSPKPDVSLIRRWVQESEVP